MDKPGARRLAGLAVPVSALWTGESVGCGEFPDLKPLGRWCASAGLGIIQLLPVNDTGSHASPYFALSAFALHPMLIRLQDLPEADSVKKEIDAARKALGSGGRVRYREVLEAKTRILRLAWERNAGKLSGSRELAAWMKANPWIRQYAPFKAFKAANADRGWKEWRSNRDPSRADIDAAWADKARLPELLFHAWTQMRASEQFLDAAGELRKLDIVLKGDLPILLNEDSADIWGSRGLFRTDRVAGAPPDGGNPLGQNWGFPVYDWDAMAKEGHAFWKDRLAQAEKYYGAYRIDHVLGFFRIWTVSARDSSGYLGRYEPGREIPRARLAALGFGPDRIRWLSLPHVRGQALRDAAGPEADEAVERALERLGNEDLYLFSDCISGERDLWELPLAHRTKDFLCRAWRDRVLLEVEEGRFVFTPRHWEAQAWGTLSDQERGALSRIKEEKDAEAAAAWEENGRTLLGMLAQSSAMLPCAEDLGSIPDCVPPVLDELGILGLRVLRWTRRWKEEGQPYIRPEDYPEKSVCTLSVHDSSSLRGWWEREGPHDGLYRALGGQGECPAKCGPGTAEFLMTRMAACRSRLFIPALQDWLALSAEWTSDDPDEERVNVPGVDDERNWSYRMPRKLEELLADETLREAARRVSAARR